MSLVCGIHEGASGQASIREMVLKSSEVADPYTGAALRVSVGRHSESTFLEGGSLWQNVPQVAKSKNDKQKLEVAGPHFVIFRVPYCYRQAAIL